MPFYPTDTARKLDQLKTRVSRSIIDNAGTKALILLRNCKRCKEAWELAICGDAYSQITIPEFYGNLSAAPLFVTTTIIVYLQIVSPQSNYVRHDQCCDNL